VGEVDEVKREKDLFFNALAARARDQAREAGIELAVQLRAGHAAEVISDVAASGGFDLVVLGHRGHFSATTCSARRPTALRSTRRAR
jgi:nucleotide-binding universal stress UspA family protein